MHLFIEYIGRVVIVYVLITHKNINFKSQKYNI